MKTDHTAQRGFTLLELLTSMGLLVIIVLMMSRMFTDTNRMWTLGTKRVVEAQEARVIMGFLIEEISSAIADETISMKMHSEAGGESWSVEAYGQQTDSIAFVGFSRTPPAGAMRRATDEIIYYVDYMRDAQNEEMDASHDEGPRYRLMRKRATERSHNPVGNPAPLTTSAYKNPEWWRRQYTGNHNAEPVAYNVVGFEIWAYDRNGVEQFNYDSTDHGTPLYIDIYLELMGDAEIAQLALMWSMNHPDRVEYLEQNVRRYSARIYLKNREGYAL